MIRLLFALGLLASPAFALDPERREATVISGRLWDGFRYVEMFLPSDNPLLTVMAGRDSAISFVQTQEYYWPLSRQVYVDFELQREPIDGVLRIERNGVIVAEVVEEPYAVLYPEGAVNGNASLLWGADAEQSYAEYQQSELEFNRRFVEAQRAQTEYERQLIEAARNGSREVVPEPGSVPEPSLRLITRPGYALRIDLEPGDYRISLVANGTEVTGTERQLRVIPAEDRLSIVADILPEERWTRPIASNSEAARIYAKAGSTFYVTLSEASRFPERDYLSVVSPQALVSPSREIWVRRRPAEAFELELLDSSQAQTVSWSDYKVEQTSSSGFGYVVRPTREGESPDIQAFQINVPFGGNNRLDFGLPDADFRRQVVIVSERKTALSLLLVFLPLAAFAGIRVRRRHS